MEMAYLIFFSYSILVPRMQLSMFLCQLHRFPMVGFGFTTTCINLTLYFSIIFKRFEAGIFGAITLVPAWVRVTPVRRMAEIQYSDAKWVITWGFTLSISLEKKTLKA